MHAVWTGQVSKVGFGAGSGLVVGYAAKRLFKLAVLGVGFLFVGVQLMALRGWVHVDFHAIEHEVMPILHASTQSQVVGALAHNVPFTSAFSAGCLFAFIWL